MKRITIIDIANETGFSKSTVSRALGDGSNIKKSTKNKILRAAKKLNYYPNEIARSLVASKNTNFIGMIVSDITNQSYVELIKSIEGHIKKFHFNIILCNTDYDLDEERRYIELLIRNRAIGVVIAAPEKNDKNLEILVRENIPFVVWGTEVNTADVDLVSVDNYEGARLAMNYLIDNGHRNIVHFAGPENFTVTEERIKAYKDVMLENGLKIDNKNIIYTKNTPESGYSMAKNLEDLKTMPTAIFAFCDYVALGVWKYLIEKGYKVPDDVSLIGFDDIETSGFKKIDLTTIRQPFKKMGEKAAEILVRNIKDHNLSKIKEKIYIKPTLIERSTVRKIS